MPNHQSSAAASILLVDDHRFVETVLQSMVASESDIALHYCEHAANALAHATALAPAVILQDLVMPGMDGLSLVQAYRREPALALTAIVVLSGNDDEETKARAFAAGADDYLVKLPAKADLLACIRRHNRRDEAADADVISALRESMAGTSAEFAARLMEQFIVEAEGRMAILHEAALRHDAGLLGITAHTLRGSAGIVGAASLAAACARVEAGAKAGGDDGVALIPAVETEFARVRDAFARERRSALAGEPSVPVPAMVRP